MGRPRWSSGGPAGRARDPLRAAFREPPPGQFFLSAADALICSSASSSDRWRMSLP